MYLTDKQLERLREVALTIDYGSVTINISASSTKLDLNIQRRIREEDEDGPGKHNRAAQKKDLTLSAV